MHKEGNDQWNTILQGNRDAFMEKLAPGSLALFFSGVPVRKTADEDYAYFANRNFAI